jgi:tetratricopeptide (TPR) repeat protein
VPVEVTRNKEGRTIVEVGELEDELNRVLSASPRHAGAAAQVLERAVAVCRADPEARGWFDLPGLLDELAEVYQELDRVDDALATMQAAIQAGYDGVPDPRCRLAEIMIRAGRTDPAAEIYAQVKADTPDDVWLYNSAGLEYAAAGDPKRALDWLTEGLRLALDDGDPENLVGQLRALRREQLGELGYELDALDTQAERFLTQRPHRRPVGDSVPPAPSWPLAGPSRSGTRSRVALSLTWFPADQFDQALRTWPDLSQDWDSTDYSDYTHRLERHLHEIDAARTADLWIAPIQIEPFQRWCQSTHRDPATASARADYAAERTRIGAPELISWPPARNAHCWCGTGRKYKKCCGHPNVTRAPD